jgi:transposase
MFNPSYTSTSIDELQQEIASLKAQLEWYKEQFKLLRQKQFGRQTEKSETVQLTLFDEMDADEVTETVTPIDNEKETVTYERTKRKHNGRNIDTSKLPRERCIHDLSDAEKICACGACMEKMGEDVSEQLDYVPAVLKVIEHVRPKYTCRACERIVSSPKPEQPITKCLASASLITEVIIKKYDHHIPIYRQSKIFLQEGIDIPDNTLGNWVMQAADLLMPLNHALWEQINATHYLQVDETPAKILKPDKKGYMWVYHSCDKNNRFILFDFDISRGGDVVTPKLALFKGLLQTDGYSGYNQLRHQADITNLGCWDHARRRFMDAIKISNENKSGVAGKLVILINKLYRIERQYKNAPAQQRQQVRLTQAKPVLDAIYVLAKSAVVLPQSLTAKAIIYLLNNEPYLTAYIHHGDAYMSNCLVENYIRPFAVGRRNWLFMGNETSAKKAALLYSLIQTCKMNHINPRLYFNYVLPKVHAIRRGDINAKDLLPQFIDKTVL